MSIAAEPTPIISAAAPTRPASSSFERTAQPPSTSPITASASTSTPSKATWLASDASSNRRGSLVWPASFGTANRVRPSVSPAAPAVRAATIIMSATWPFNTNALVPDSLKPLPERSAFSAVASGRCLAPSSIASATIAAPLAIFGSHSSDNRPLAFSASTAATAVVRNGDGVRLRPISSSTIPASTWPRPRPPFASGTMMPVKPISANCFHRSRLKPVSSLLSRSVRRCLTGAASAMNGAAVSRSIV